MKRTEINILLLKKNITQAALAREVGVVPCTISLLFAGRIKVSDHLRARLAARLGISRRSLDGMIERARQN